MKSKVVINQPTDTPKMRFSQLDNGDWFLNRHGCLRQVVLNLIDGANAIDPQDGLSESFLEDESIRCRVNVTITYEVAE